MGRRPTKADLLLGAHEWFARRAVIVAGSRRADRFAAFGAGSIICFPPTALFGEHAIRIGEETLIGPYCALSAGMVPGQRLLSDRVVTIGDRCLIGRHAGIAGHLEVVIGDDVYLGPNVFITDQNHDMADRSRPIGHQSRPEAPVRIGAGSWLGTNSVVLPGVTIGRQVAIGANSVVTGDLPDGCVAVGAPARIVG